MNHLAFLACVVWLGVVSASQAQDYITFSSTGHNIPIPDTPASSAVLDIVVTSPTIVLDLNVGLIITHTWQGDLTATIEHIGFGPPVTIINRPWGIGASVGFSADNFGNLDTGTYFVLNDEAANIYDTPFVTTPGVANVNGFWKPDGPPFEGISSLSVFKGQNMAGTWRLRVVDHVSTEIGAIRAMQLTFLLPGPPVTALFGFAAIVLPHRRRRMEHTAHESRKGRPG